MKPTHFLFAVSLASLTALSACSTTATKEAKHDSPETVMITYYVKPGSEGPLKETLIRAWEIYRHEHLVLAEPHTIVADKDSAGKIRVIEIFSWISHEAPDHAPASVKQVWAELASLCEVRDGHRPLEGGEVGLMVPARE